MLSGGDVEQMLARDKGMIFSSATPLLESRSLDAYLHNRLAAPFAGAGTRWEQAEFRAWVVRSLGLDSLQFTDMLHAARGYILAPATRVGITLGLAGYMVKTYPARIAEVVELFGYLKERGLQAQYEYAIRKMYSYAPDSPVLQQEMIQFSGHPATAATDSARTNLP
jgi:hypothetical protein